MTYPALMPDELTSPLTEPLNELVSCLNDVHLDCELIDDANKVRQDDPAQMTMQAQSAWQQTLAFAEMAKARISNTLSKALLSAKSFFTSFFETKDVFLQPRRFESYLGKTKHVAVMDKLVIVPRGLKVTLLEHLRHQTMFQQALQPILEQILIPLERFLSTLLHAPESLSSLQQDRRLAGFKTIDVDKLKAAFAKDFSRDSAERRPYGEVIERSSDWAEVYSLHNELVLQMKAIPRDAVQKKLDAIIPLLTLLAQRLEEEPDMYKPSGVTAKTMGEFLFNLAKMVEFYSIFSFNLEAIGASIDDASALAKHHQD
jgi:hypothetical protein